MKDKQTVELEKEFEKVAEETGLLDFNRVGDVVENPGNVSKLSDVR